MNGVLNATRHVYFEVDPNGCPWVINRGVVMPIGDGRDAEYPPDADELFFDWEHFEEWRLAAVVDFVNARDLDELMQSLDELVVPIFLDNPHFHRTVPFYIPPEDAHVASAIRKINRCLYFGKRSRSRVQKIADYLKRYAPYPQKNSPGGSETPFVEIIKAKNDLMRVCRLLAWYRGRFTNPTALNDIDYLVGVRALDPLDFSTDTLLGSFYLDYCFDETFYCEMRRISEKAINSPQSITREDIGNFLSATISLLYQANNQSSFSADHGRTLKTQYYLGGMWEQLADAIMRPKGKNSVVTCPNCGRFILMDRSSKTYCNESCYESYTRNHGKPATRNYLKWPSETYCEGE